MTHYFDPRECIYFWGQDRFGGLVPLLGQPFFKLGLSAVISASLAQYLILLIGFLAISSFIKSRLFCIVLALVWFLPPTHFIDFLLFYSGVEYSLVFLAFYFINKADARSAANEKIGSVRLLLMAAIILTIAIWVSDMAIITIFSLFLTRIIYYIQEKRFSIFFLRDVKFYVYVVSAILGFLVISTLKNSSSQRIDYTFLNTIQQTQETFRLLLESASRLLTFDADEPFTSLYIYLLILMLIIILKKVDLLKNLVFTNKLLTFLLLDALIVFIVILSSHWTLLNGVPRRYFTTTYISFLVALIFILDNLYFREATLSKIKWFAIGSCLVGGLGSLYHFASIWPGTLTPKTKVIAKLGALEKIGIIGNYWNSYVYSCVDPNNVKATPYDLAEVRNMHINTETFEQKNIYVIRDMWLDDFPDTLNVQDKMLIKSGTEFRLVDANMCKYQFVRSYSPTQKRNNKK
ncbi:MAG: hypothetical protein IT223_00100 [Crocinitomicaceae bacterium]|nr:hypothetical protein [Crocinitomicaceae bacterium]